VLDVQHDGRLADAIDPDHVVGVPASEAPGGRGTTQSVAPADLAQQVRKLREGVIIHAAILTYQSPSASPPLGSDPQDPRSIKGTPPLGASCRHGGARVIPPLAGEEVPGDAGEPVASPSLSEVETPLRVVGRHGVSFLPVGRRSD
jgi:hypothetical protein